MKKLIAPKMSATPRSPFRVLDRDFAKKPEDLTADFTDYADKKYKHVSNE